jgi:hypothetical protein
MDTEPAFVGPEDQRESELIAQEYEEEAAMVGDPNDTNALATRMRKVEERLATIEDYLGRPPSNDTLEARLEQLGSGDGRDTSR